MWIHCLGTCTAKMSLDSTVRELVMRCQKAGECNIINNICHYIKQEMLHQKFSIKLFIFSSDQRGVNLALYGAGATLKFTDIFESSTTVGVPSAFSPTSTLKQYTRRAKATNSSRSPRCIPTHTRRPALRDTKKTICFEWIARIQRDRELTRKPRKDVQRSFA